MRLLPWRKPKDEDEKNPWGDEPYLSGWVPGTAPALDLFAMIASISHVQWELARSQGQLWRALAQLGWMYAFLSLLWGFIAWEVMAIKWGLW